MRNIQRERERESKSKSIYSDFFHDTISELGNIRLMFSSFNPFVPSPPKQQKTPNSFSVVTESFVTIVIHLHFDNSHSLPRYG